MISRIFRGSLCEPLSVVGEIKNYLQYPSNTSKYTTSDPYWMKNKLLFNTPFWIHNNLNMIIKIFITIYLSLTVLFPSVPLYLHNARWRLSIKSEIRKMGSPQNNDVRGIIIGDSEICKNSILETMRYFKIRITR